MSEDQPDFYTDTAETSWVIVKLHRINLNGGRTDVELLRPKNWVTNRHLSEGEKFDFTASEPTLSGTMIIDFIRAVEKDLGPMQSHDSARMITGRFITTKAAIYRLTFTDESTEVRATGDHPLYSLDRHGWVDVAALRTGERFRTRDGEIAVKSVEQLDGTEVVYNLEVHGDHTYFVTNREVLSHNANGCPVEMPVEPAGGWKSGQEVPWGRRRPTDSQLASRRQAHGVADRYRSRCAHVGSGAPKLRGRQELGGYNI